MKTLGIIAAACLSGAAYGHQPCPDDFIPPDDIDKLESSYNEYIAKLHQWRENERQEDARDFREEQAQEQAQAERERQTELMEEMLDAIQDLDR